MQLSWAEILKTLKKKIPEEAIATEWAIIEEKETEKRC